MDFFADRLREKCGLFGVYGRGRQAARLVHTGLWALQHRGQESSGIASSDGKRLYFHKKMGLVAHAYSEHHLQKLRGHLAIGHNRYSTSGRSVLRHSQPVIAAGGALALAHNGNLPTTTTLENFLTAKKIATRGLNDSELMAEAVAYFWQEERDLAKAVRKAWPLFQGVFSLLIMDRTTLVALRDRRGIRPLAMGKLDRGFVFSSETCALNVIKARFWREVQPGEMVVVQNHRWRSIQLSPADQKLDIFEFVYFARPDSHLLGKSVYEVRKNFGRILAKEHPQAADLIIPVPDSAVPAATGYSEVTGMPIDYGLVKNRYIHRTFIRPDARLRQTEVNLKLNAIAEVISGRDVVLLDDSIVRGTTARGLVTKIRQAGARKIHFLVSSPPVRFPDFYGIDTPSQKDLIAARMSLARTRRFIGADSLAYLSYDGMIEATGLPASVFCTSCFSGHYPVDIGSRVKEIVNQPSVKKKVLIVGSGGREHALGWKLSQSPQVDQLFFAPGNGGTAALGENVNIDSEDIFHLRRFAKNNNIDLTVVGPEAPLALGIVDTFRHQGLAIFGPTKKAARLETSKAWAVRFMERHHIPHPETRVFTNATRAKRYLLSRVETAVVVKADGLAAGKGVFVCNSQEEALKAVERLMIAKEFSRAGAKILLQEKAIGPEVSIIALSDGEKVIRLVPCQDHKRAFDSDQGPNTGGMGAFAPVPWITKDLEKRITQTILLPTIRGMRAEGYPFVGVLYAGLILTAGGPSVLEFNARFGDPETQPLLMLLKTDLYCLIEACVTGRLRQEKVEFSGGAAACVVLASGGYPGSFQKGKAVKGLNHHAGTHLQVFHAGTTVNGKGLVTTGGRVLGITAQGHNITSALRKAYGAIGLKAIHFEGMHYRRDIGKEAGGYD